jgi:hypothetical protein
MGYVSIAVIGIDLGKNSSSLALLAADRSLIPAALSGHSLAQVRLVREAMRSGISMSLFQAFWHASRMAS